VNRDWMDDATCRTTDPDIFFPPEETKYARSVHRAKKVCAGCPVVAECAEYALNHPDHMLGVWGGMSESERRTLRRKFGMSSYVKLAFVLAEDRVVA
jgi:WhiB family redox-sensing transcriptional regulator